MGKDSQESCCQAVIYSCAVHTLGIALRTMGFRNIGKEHGNKAHKNKRFEFKKEPADDLRFFALPHRLVFAAFVMSG